MLERCLECAGALVPGVHWLCLKHMHARAAKAGLCGSSDTGPVVAREAVFLRALVFDFPESCSFNEFIARVRYVLNILCSRTREFDLLVLHGAYMRVSHRVSRNEMRDLICSFVEFVCRNAHVSRTLMDACAIFVRAWYPRLICTASLGAAKKSERMLHALERAAGARDFLVLADITLAFAGVLNRDVLEHVYTCYAREIRCP
jgi:hypothetical protein